MRAESMRVRFDTTIDEMIEAGLRGYYRTRAARSLWWTDTVVSMLFVGTITAGVVFALFTWLGGSTGGLLPRGSVSDFWLRVGLAVAAGVLGACWLPFEARRHVRNRLLKLLTEQYGDGPFAAEAEVSGDGITTRLKGNVMVTRWLDVESVAESPDTIDIHLRHGLIAVPNRAFRSEEERGRFAGEARRYHEESRAGAASQWAGVPASEGIKLPGGVSETADALVPVVVPNCCEAMRDEGVGLRERYPGIRFCPWCGSST